MADNNINNKKNKKLAIVLIRGTIGMRHDIKKTAKLFNLHRKHTCVVVPDTVVNRGMAAKIKDFATFGNIDDETYKELVDKRGSKDKTGKLKNVFRLSPPRKGFERKGIKQSFSNGGALGNRKEKINDLLKRMI
jgi:large subunit ribosomal protein L30